MYRHCTRAGFGALTLVIGAALHGCATNYTESYQERLVKSLPYPFGVTFSNTQTFPGEVLCGDYTASDDGGLQTRTRAFVVTADQVLANPSDAQSSVFCSDNAAEALFALTGIGGPGADWSRIATIRDDMRALDEAIGRFHNAQHSPPRRLDDLRTAGLIPDEELLTDPWGRPYAYAPGLSGGSTARYDLATLGSDGATGGTGPDADINRDWLELVAHVLRIEGY